MDRLILVNENREGEELGEAVTIQDLERDDEYFGIMLRLVIGTAENARLDAEELTLARRKIIRKNSGEGRGSLPLRRRYVREKLDEPKHKLDQEEYVTIDRLEARIAELDREIALDQIRSDEVRLAQAEALNDRVDAYMTEHGVSDYGTALREVVRLTEIGQSEPTVGEVEDHMRREGIEDFGDGLRDLMSTRQIKEQTFETHIPHVSDADYDSHLRSRMKELGYDLGE